MLSQAQLQEFLLPALEELGLTEYEKKLYLLSLTLGPTPVSEFAKQLRVSRPNVYKVILGLEKHGLAIFSEKIGRRRTFSVESPHVLIERLREKREKLIKLDQDVFKILPDLLALYQQGDRPTTLKIFDTKATWIKAFFETLSETSGEHLFFGNLERFLAMDPHEQARWVEERTRRGIKGRLLALPSTETQSKKISDQSELRETRILKLQPFETSFQIFGKKAIVWQSLAPLAILIEDEYIVAMLKAIFEGFWASSSAV
jgi:sugar-specific transcriptional regulator TrmB